MKLAERRVEHLTESLHRLESKNKQLTSHHDQLRGDNEDLKVFLDVLSSCDGIEKTWKESESKARDHNAQRERESLKRKIEELEEEGTVEMEHSKKEMEKLTKQLTEIQGQLVECQRRRRFFEEDLTQQKNLNGALEEELEVGHTFEGEMFVCAANGDGI